MLRVIRRSALPTQLTIALDEDTKNELHGHIRSEFERRKKEQSLEKIKYYLSQGKREFHQLQDMIEFTARK